MMFNAVCIALNLTFKAECKVGGANRQMNSQRDQVYFIFKEGLKLLKTQETV